MSFLVDPEAYTRFMGRFSVPLAAQFADTVGVRPGQRALDVGCGAGALTDELVRRLGVGQVAAADPSPPFVAAVRSAYPDMDVRVSTAEDLDHEADFDVVLACLVVQFMQDPLLGVGRMMAAAKPGGTVGACVWDHAGGRGPLSTFLETAAALDPLAPDEAGMVGTADGELPDVFEAAGLQDVHAGALVVDVRHASFDDWWEPFTFGVGPAGAHVAGLDDDGRARLEAALRERLPDGPFSTQAFAWAAWGTRPS